jgi:hypothetical protein
VNNGASPNASNPMMGNGTGTTGSGGC